MYPELGLTTTWRNPAAPRNSRSAQIRGFHAFTVAPGRPGERQHPEQQALEAADDQGTQRDIDGSPQAGGAAAPFERPHESQGEERDDADTGDGAHLDGLLAAGGQLRDDCQEDEPRQHPVEVSGLEVGDARHQHAHHGNEERPRQHPEPALLTVEAHSYPADGADRDQ